MWKVAYILSGMSMILEIQSKTFRLGVLQSSFYPPIVSIEAIAPAMKMAIEDFQKTGSLSEHSFEIIWDDDICLSKVGVHQVVRFWREENIDVLIGSICSTVVAPTSHYLTVWDVPIFSHGASDSLLDDKTVYNTLVRLGPVYNKLGRALLELYKTIGWRKTMLIISDEPVCVYGAEVVWSIFPKHGIVVTEWIRTNLNPTTAEFDDYLTRAKERARIILLCIGMEATKNFILRAHSRGFTSPEYVIIVYLAFPLGEYLKPWLIELPPNASDALIETRKQAFYNTKIVWMSGLTTKKVHEFLDEIPNRLFEHPWTQYNGTLQKGVRGSVFSVYLYDTTYTYIYLLNESLHEGGNYRSGSYLFNKSRNRHLPDMLSGPVSLDDQADRQPDFRMLYFKPGMEVFTEDIEISLMKAPGERVYSLYNSTYWGTPDNKPPPDTPTCGFHGELCPKNYKVLITAVSATVACVCVLLLVFVGLFVNYRKKKMEAEIDQMIWKINFDEIKHSRRAFWSVMAMSMKSFQDHESMMTNSQRSMSCGENQVFIEQGEYHGNTVAIKYIPSATKIVLNRRDLTELKILKQMNHQNVNPFLGACTDPPNICVISQYCTKGSLQDILENEDITLEWMFRISFMMDLAKGMSYLHHSPLESHGSLSSSNCLVDNRWVLKISSFGLQAFFANISTDQVEESDHRKYGRMLWTAPEILRMKEKPRNGSQKGDLYSFGIILQEIMYRDQPYFMQDTSPKDIIGKVIQGGKEPFRPKLPESLPKEHLPAMELMLSCWAEQPNERPDFRKCLRQLKLCTHGRNTNLMDVMVQRLEKYANNLEDIVGRRTRDLVEEKKKTDTLLSRMLPRSVVDELKRGSIVKPQLYDEVTVFFSDIVGFTVLSSESTPIQVIDLLNDLYTLFDDIIATYNVYKVETIGDAYMVVSGLPERNGRRHASEVASMALGLLGAVVETFKIRHQPERRLELRSGIHTGPCAAGVVGLTMPRYCLFGDTVNMASRMESNGQALKIHISKSTHDSLVLIGGFRMENRGELDIKGKGKQRTYWLLGKDKEEILPT